MPTSPTSSVAFSATLTPLRSSREWQRLLLLLQLGAAAGPVLSLNDAPLRSVLVLALLAIGGIELLRIARQPSPPSRLRLHADGRCEVRVDEAWQALALHPGSLLGRRLGWLMLTPSHGPRSVLIVRRADNGRQWRRARLIWRFAPQPV